MPEEVGGQGAPAARGAARKRSAGYQTSQGQDTAAGRQELAAQLARRRECADRLPPLADGTRDPWRERQRRYLSLDSARAAWSHLHAYGLVDRDTAAVLLAEVDPAELAAAGIPAQRRGGERS